MPKKKAVHHCSAFFVTIELRIERVFFSILNSHLGLAPHLFSPYCESVNIHTRKMMQMARLAQ